MSADCLYSRADIRAKAEVCSLHGLKVLAAAAERRTENIERFVGWPALSESWRADADHLRKTLARRSAE